MVDHEDVMWSYECNVDVRKTLADFLRIGFGLTDTHLGREHWVCGDGGQ